MEIETKEIEIKLTVRIKTVKWAVAWDWQRYRHPKAVNGPQVAQALDLSSDPKKRPE